MSIVAVNPFMWRDTRELRPAKAYECGYCHKTVSSVKGWSYTDQSLVNVQRTAAICPHCDCVTYFHGEVQHPDNPYGEHVENLPDDVSQIYTEIRNCTQVGAFTASTLLARKLLMTISVGLKAKEGEGFDYYIDWLASNGYVPPKAKDWITHLKKRGNNAAHKVAVIPEEDAKDLVSFTSMILRLVYDYPARIPQVATT